MMDLMVRGGPLMWPILIESILALWIIIERGYFVTAVLPRLRAALSRLVDNAGNPGDKESPDESNELAKAIKRAREDGAVSRTLLTLEAERLAGTAERYLSILSIVAQTAPLLGLLGTVMGMIDTFIKIHEMGGQATPSALAGGIWEALITTAAGLTVAIPALIAYIGYGRVADRFARQVESAASQIVHKLSKEGLEVMW
jgi:biopolymer transport protein ExbB